MYARLFCRVYGLPVVVVRVFMTYGPRQEPTKLVPCSVLALSRGQPLHIRSGTRVCDFVYVLDVVRGLLRAAMSPNVLGKTVDLGTGAGTSVRDVVQLVVELSGTAVRTVSYSDPDRIGERVRIADHDATWRLLGWRPMWSLRDGLMETVAWYRSGVEHADETR